MSLTNLLVRLSRCSKDGLESFLVAAFDGGKGFPVRHDDALENRADTVLKSFLVLGVHVLHSGVLVKIKDAELLLRGGLKRIEQEREVERPAVALHEP
jgi:hypothetical protein